MTAPKKPRASEAWEAIDEAAFRAEVDRVVGMSDEEVEAELLRDGFDPASLGSGEAGEGGHGTGGEARERETPQANDAPLGQAQGKPGAEAKGAVVTRLPLRTRPLQTVTWAVAAGFLLLLGAVAAIKNMDGGEVATSPAQHAAALRKEAKGECAKARWRECLDRLDQADEADPAGADDANIKTLRKEAEQGLAGGAGGPR